MKIYGYGEDSLTLWVLQNKLGDLLDKLDDETSEDDAVVFYRPSFGRGASPCFGEFDAIVSTSECTYLIEAKTNSSSEYKKSKNEIVLETAQLKRHDLMQSVISDFPKLPKIVTKNNEEKEISEDSVLYRSIKQVYLKLKSKKIKNVLLFINLDFNSSNHLAYSEIVKSSKIVFGKPGFSVIEVKFKNDTESNADFYDPGFVEL